MFGWFKNLTGSGAPAAPAAASPAARVGTGQQQSAPPVEVAEDRLGSAAKDFYRGLLSTAEPGDLQNLEADDRLFLSGILKRLRENRFDVPILPGAALEISRLLGDPSSDAGDFAQVLKGDPALSIDVLRIANSAYYGFAKEITSVRDAVVRIGLNQLRGLIIMTHLHGKVLHGGCFQREAGWIAELSMALAQLGQALARDLSLKSDVAYTRGVLMHVEHFIMMGTVAEVSREHRRSVRPTVRALHEGVQRFGPKVRELAARAWGLEDFLVGKPGEEDMTAQLTARRYVQLQDALIGAWIAERSVDGVEGVSPENLRRALERVRPGADPGESRA